MKNQKDNRTKSRVLVTDKIEKPKYKVFFSILMTVLFMTTICSGASVMTMTTTSNTVNISVSGLGAVIIDFGDGTIKNGILSDDNTDINNLYSHNYSGTDAHTITITGEITIFYCRDNQLTNLDVSNNTALKFLFCNNNQLTSLYVSQNIALAGLICHNNQLTSLDVSKNTALYILVLEGNQFTSSALNAVFETLHNDDNVRDLMGGRINSYT